MTFTNRELILVHVLFRALLMAVLVGGLIWGFVVRLIDGEAYLGFVALIISVLREIRLPFFDEDPRMASPGAAGSH